MAELRKEENDRSDTGGDEDYRNDADLQERRAAAMDIPLPSSSGTGSVTGGPGATASRGGSTDPDGPKSVPIQSYMNYMNPSENNISTASRARKQK